MRKVDATGPGRSAKKRYIALCLLAMTAIVAVFWLYRTRSSVLPPVRNVLLISIDTCRADHLGCYGFDRPATPHIDALAKEATLFENTLSPVPLTLPAHCSMLTGTDPVYHGVHDNLDYQLATEHQTLAEILRQEGFTTGALVSAFVLDKQFGLDQGFGTYHDNFEDSRLLGNMSERVGGEATRLAIDWLGEHQSDRFFYFLHYFDPHHEYLPPEPYASQFADSPYAGEIAYTDHCIGRVIAELKSLDLYDSTLIVIVGDHGEMLGEHGEGGHSFFIYQSALHVPLLIKRPGQSCPKRVSQLTGLIDLAPTVCKLLAIEPPEQMQGIDLSPFLLHDNPEPVSRQLYCESLTATKYQGNSLIGLVSENWKYIQTTRPELYHWSDDPKETRNLILDDPRRARMMKQQLQQHLESTVAPSVGGQTKPDESARRKLEALGYISGTSVTASSYFDQSKEDPKDLIDFHRQIDTVMTLFFQEEYEQAQTLCRTLLRDRPDVFLAQYSMGRIEVKLKNYAEAAVHLQQAAAQKPENAELQNELGFALRCLGNFTEAESACQKALALKPDFAHARENLGMTFMTVGKMLQAVEQFQKAIADLPDNPELHNNLAVTLASLEQYNEAIAHYKQAIALRPDYVEAKNNLGAALGSVNRLDEAVAVYEEALELAPEAANVHHNLARALQKQNNPERALHHFRKAVSLDPQSTVLQLSLAQALQARGVTAEAIKSWEQVVQLSPDDPTSHYRLGNALASDRQYEKAAVHYQKSLTLEPRFAQAHTNLGNVLSSLGRLDEAATHFQRSLALEPNSANANFNYAQCLSAQGKFAASVDRYRQVIKLQPKWPEPYNAVAWILATCHDPMIRDPAQALIHAEQAITRVNAEAPAVLDTLAAAQAAAGRFEQAIKTARKGIALARKAGNDDLSREMEKHLKLYMLSRPLVQSPPTQTEHD